MSSSTQPNTASRWPTFLPFFILILCAAGILAARLHTYSEPIERDLALYAVCGHEQLLGGRMYRDYWEIKPPGTIWTYALAESIVGYGDAEIFLLGIAAAWITLVGIFVAGKRLGNRWTGVLAALFWTLTCSDMYLQANQPNVEVFINAAMTWFVVVLLGAAQDARAGKPLLWRGVVLGLLAGLASLYKQFMVVPALLMATALLAAPPSGPPMRARILKLWLPAIAALCAFWVVVIGYMSVTGSLEGFIIVLTKWSTSYAGNPLGNLAAGLAPKTFISYYNRFMWPMGLLGIAGLVLAKRTPDQKSNAAILGAFVAGTYLSVSFPGKFFPHYYQLWLPVMCMGGAWGYFQILRVLQNSKPLSRPVKMAGAAAILSLLTIRELPFYTMTPDEWSEKKYFSREFVDAKTVGQEIGTIIKPETRTYQWGMEANIYFYSQRRATCMLDSALLSPNSLVLSKGNPLYDEFQKQFRTSMEKYTPPVITVNLNFDREGPAYQYLYKHYRPFPHDALRGNYLLAVRKGSALERKLLDEEHHGTLQELDGPQVPPYLPEPGKALGTGVYDRATAKPKNTQYLW